MEKLIFRPNIFDVNVSLDMLRNWRSGKQWDCAFLKSSDRYADKETAVMTSETRSRAIECSQQSRRPAPAQL